MSTTELAWSKSSYSGSSGDSCVEVAMAWHKSTRSGSEGDSCVEVAACPCTVHVRDSKDTAMPGLSLSPAAWTAFINHTAGS
ncbi:DUF397 domain-containing protein [Streptomyces gobiensis]|uniref:DUF397 domain-containing protein n=1 Tax=Streptomyces gobiensis TaxID=2875706 RepID=UPI001E586B8F|nr:DUF397 domain-containing protein [Streptomyces gobiensis]UGY90768.1 DUF397 domain-containing protein [Streptomyces gobiensis]